MNKGQPHHKTWQRPTELVLAGCSIGGSIAAVITQQVTVAIATSIPLSLAVGLNTWNRRTLDQVSHTHQTTLVRLEQQQHSNDQTVAQITDSHQATLIQLLEHEQSITEISNSSISTAELDDIHKKFEILRRDNIEQKQQLSALHNPWETTQPSDFITEVRTGITTLSSQLEHLSNAIQQQPVDDLQHQLNILQQSTKQLQNKITRLDTYDDQLKLLRQELVELRALLKQPPEPFIETPDPLVVTFTCSWCHKQTQQKPIEGGGFGAEKFCQTSCRREYEKRNN